MTAARLDISCQHFLLVDDHAFVRNLIQGQLTGLGAKQFSHAENGKAALEVFARQGHYITFVISDWNMNPMNGLELLRVIRMGQVLELSPATPFLMLTGHADPAVVTTAAQLDVNGYLVKPVAAAKLAAAMLKAFSKPISARGPKFYEAVSTAVEPKCLI